MCNYSSSLINQSKRNLKKKKNLRRQVYRSLGYMKMTYEYLEKYIYFWLTLLWKVLITSMCAFIRDFNNTVFFYYYFFYYPYQKIKIVQTLDAAYKYYFVSKLCWEKLLASRLPLKGLHGAKIRLLPKLLTTLLGRNSCRFTR